MRALKDSGLRDTVESLYLAKEVELTAKYKDHYIVSKILPPLYSIQSGLYKRKASICSKEPASLCPSVATYLIFVQHYENILI